MRTTETGSTEALKENRSPRDDLGRLRLLMAFDALLREGSVGGAARTLGLQSSAVSRLLAQLRDLYDDPLFTRTGKGLVPTQLAETLRPRIRALIEESESLVSRATAARTPRSGLPTGWERPPLIEIPPLSIRPANLLDGQPTPGDVARRLARIGANADPQLRLAKYIATIGGGPGRSRPLTRAEADDALSVILEGQGDPIQIGAFLSLTHYRGATAAELAGFVTAARRHCAVLDEPEIGTDLDWPCYMSPKLRSPPWFLHAARLVAQAGHKVLLHGHSGREEQAEKLPMACEMAGIPISTSVTAARRDVAACGIAYLPLLSLSAQIHRLIGLHGLFEMRGPVNIVVHMLNPLNAPTSLLGVANPMQRDLHRHIGGLLGLANLAILGNNRDFAQFTPFKATTVLRLVDGEPDDLHLPGLPAPTTHPPTGLTSREYWQAVWTGAARDEMAETIIVTTAAIALMTIRARERLDFAKACEIARDLWSARQISPG